MDLLLLHVTDKAEKAQQGILPRSGKYHRVWDVLEVPFGELAYHWLSFQHSRNMHLSWKGMSSKIDHLHRLFLLE